MEKKIIEDKLDSLMKLLSKLKDILEARKKNKLKEYLFYAAEKKAEEIVELAVSINQEILRSTGEISQSYYESFTALERFKLFDNDELKALASTAGFRNRLAHEYLELDEGIALNAMERIMLLYPRYIKKVAEILDAH